MRILQLGDTHLGCRDALIGAPDGVDRARDHLAAFDAALAPAHRGEVDLVVHTGDLFDRSRPPASAVVAAAERLVAVARQVPVLVIAGNHDRRGLLRYIPHRVDGLHVVDRPRRVEVAGLRIGAIPFLRDPAAWAEAARRVCGTGVDFAVAHQAFDGGRVPGFTFREGRPADTIGPRHVPRGVRWILSGHLHPRQRHRVGDAEVVHAGSTERTALSERGQAKGYAVWTWGRGAPRVRWVDLPARPMVRVEGPRDLERLVPGAWVALSPDLPESWGRRVIARGAYLRASTRRAGRRRGP